MFQTVESGNNQKLMLTYVSSQSDYSGVFDMDSDSEIKMDSIKRNNASPTLHIPRMMIKEAVYVRKLDDRREELVYNSNMMVRRKYYQVIWYGDYYVLIKEDNGVGIYKFYPDENNNGI